MPTAYSPTPKIIFASFGQVISDDRGRSPHATPRDPRTTPLTYNENICYEKLDRHDREAYRVGQKSKPVYFCNNCVYCQPIFTIFGTYTL